MINSNARCDNNKESQSILSIGLRKSTVPATGNVVEAVTVGADISIVARTGTNHR